MQIEGRSSMLPFKIESRCENSHRLSLSVTGNPGYYLGLFIGGFKEEKIKTKSSYEPLGCILLTITCQEHNSHLGRTVLARLN